MDLSKSDIKYLRVLRKHPVFGKYSGLDHPRPSPQHRQKTRISQSSVLVHGSPVSEDSQMQTLAGPQSAEKVSLESTVKEGGEKKNAASNHVLAGFVIVGTLLFFLAAMLPAIYSIPMARNAAVKGNMRTVQIAAETYATKTGHYPAKVTNMMPFLPGGDKTVGGKPGTLPVNPMDGSLDSVKDSKFISTWKQLTALRMQSSDKYKTGLKPGQIAYTAIEGLKGYAITGTIKDGYASSGVGGRTLVLSCQ